MKRSEMASLVQELFTAKVEHAKLTNDDTEMRLGAPSKDAQLLAIEEAMGAPLPPSYRAFLELHDGWRGFTGGLDILSSNERNDTTYTQNIASLLDAHSDIAEAERVPAQAIYVAASKDDSSLVYLDPRERRPDGEMAVVEYGREGEADRHESFAAFLQSHLALTRELIAEA